MREKDERADPPGSFPKNSNYRHYVFGWTPRLTYRLSTSGGVPSRSSASKVITVAQSVRNYTVVLYLFSRRSVQVTEHELRTQYTVQFFSSHNNKLAAADEVGVYFGFSPVHCFLTPSCSLWEFSYPPPTIYITHTKYRGMFNQYSYSMTFFKQVSLKLFFFCQDCLQNNLSLKNDLQSLFTNW